MQAGTNITSPKEAFRALKIIFYVLVAGMVLFVGTVFTLNQLDEPAITDNTIDQVFLITAIFLLVSGLIFSNIFYRKRMAVSRQYGKSLMEKLEIYRGALVVYLSLCEGPALFSIIAYYITGNTILLGITALMLAAMIVKWPAKSRIFNELQLDSKEQMELF